MQWYPLLKLHIKKNSRVFTSVFISFFSVSLLIYMGGNCINIFLTEKGLNWDPTYNR